MAVTKLDLSMLDENTEIYFGEIEPTAKFPMWMSGGRIVFVTYGRLQELFDVGPIIPPPSSVREGGFVGVDEETILLDGGLVGVDAETSFLDGGLVGSALVS